MPELAQVFNHPKFIGLWTYRPHKGTRQFCASIMVNCEVRETKIFDTWEEALNAAHQILEKTWT